MSIVNRVSDYLIYIGIGIVVLAAIVIAAESGVSKDEFSLWYGFMMFSAFLFGQFILTSRRYWKLRPFRMWTSIAAIGHTGAFICAVRSGLYLGAWGWIICVTIEAAVLMGARAMLMRNDLMK